MVFASDSVSKSLERISKLSKNRFIKGVLGLPFHNIYRDSQNSQSQDEVTTVERLGKYLMQQEVCDPLASPQTPNKSAFDSGNVSD